MSAFRLICVALVLCACTGPVITSVISWCLAMRKRPRLSGPLVFLAAVALRFVVLVAAVAIVLRSEHVPAAFVCVGIGLALLVDLAQFLAMSAWKDAHALRPACPPAVKYKLERPEPIGGR